MHDVTKIDKSTETGDLVVCTCGFVLGPFADRQRAKDVASAHRRIHATDRQNERQRAARAV